MRRWFGNACSQAGLGWTPDTFWQATVAEYFMACEGHNRINRGGVEPPTQEEIDDLAARYPGTASIKRKKQ